MNKKKKNFQSDKEHLEKVYSYHDTRQQNIKHFSPKIKKKARMSAVITRAINQGEKKGKP